MTEQKKQTTQKPGDATPALATLERNIADSVLNRIRQFTANKDIRLPADYSAENAIKSAWLILLDTKTSKQDGERPVLEVCTKESIANSLLNMVLQGLNPVKKQCDFIAYGNKLTMQREYHGTILLAKRYGGVKEPIGNVIYEGDEFEYSIDEAGRKHITRHVQKFENIDTNKIKGAYATLLFEDETKPPYVEIMTMKQIQQAWMQGATKGASPAHRNFPDEMCKKTVIGRACKLYISSSDDSALFEEEERDPRQVTIQQEISDQANQEELTIDAAAEEVTKETPKLEEKEQPRQREQKQTTPKKQEQVQQPKQTQPAANELFEQQKGPGF